MLKWELPGRGSNLLKSSRRLTSGRTPGGSVIPLARSRARLCAALVLVLVLMLLLVFMLMVVLVLPLCVGVSRLFLTPSHVCLHPTSPRRAAERASGKRPGAKHEGRLQLIAATRRPQWYKIATAGSHSTIQQRSAVLEDFCPPAALGLPGGARFAGRRSWPSCT